VIESTTPRLDRARGLIGDREIMLGGDGAITAANIWHPISHGADLVVTESAVYKGGQATANARALIAAARGGD
jgi:pentose-5-phosphate-3-epimerase